MGGKPRSERGVLERGLGFRVRRADRVSDDGCMKVLGGMKGMYKGLTLRVSDGFTRVL